MTNLLKLPQVTLTVELGSNEPWDASNCFGYVDGSNNPISGAGITLILMARAAPVAAKPWIAASNVSGPVNGVAQNGTVAWGGAGGNLIVPNIPVSTIALMPPATYFAEILGIADGTQKRLAEITLIIDQAIAR